MQARLQPRALGSVFLVGALALACGPTDEEMSTDPTDVRAEVSEAVRTVVNVQWKTDKPSTGYVEYGPTAELGLVTPMIEEEATSHKQALVGLKADTLYYYRVVSWQGDAGQSEKKSIRTGFLPPGLPQLERTGSGHDEFIVTPLLGTFRRVVIIDPEGEVVWYHDDEPSDFEFMRARLSRDGKGVIYNSTHMTPDPSPDSEIVRVSFDGSERTAIPIPFLAHDFVEHADGTIGTLVLEDREVDGMNVRGNRIIEVDPEGNETEIWTSWNCFDPVEDPGDEPDIGAALGWTFTNALDYVASENVYYVGVHNFSSIAKVDRETGACEWVFGFTASTIELDINADTFQHQHQFQVFGNHILVMDNEGSLTPQESRVLEYELDLENNVATQVWSYISTPPAYTWVLGEPVRYTNGDTFINWSTAGTMERVSESGEVLWKIESNLGAAFGFNTLAKSLYAP